MIQQDRRVIPHAEHRKQAQMSGNSCTGTQHADVALQRIHKLRFLPSPQDIQVLSDHRRLRVSTLIGAGYHSLLAILVCSIDSALVLQTTGARALAYMTACVALAPLHVLLTHALILQASPTLRELVHRLVEFVSVKQYRLLFLPSLLHSGAHMAVLWIAICTVSAARASGDPFALSNLLHSLTSTASTALALMPAMTTILTLVEADMLLDNDKATVSWERGAVTKGRTSNEATSIYLGPCSRALRSLTCLKLKTVTVLYAKWWLVLFVASGIAVC